MSMRPEPIIIYDEGGIVPSEDAFLGFVDYARSVLSSDESIDFEGEEGTRNPPWSWIVSRILKTCTTYSSGVTAAILLSDLFQAWIEQSRIGTSRIKSDCMIQLRKKHRRIKLPNTVTVDSIYEKKFLSVNSTLEVVVVDAYQLPGTNIYMLTLGDVWSTSTIDLYLHKKYYHLVDPNHGILKKGREIFLTGCHLRNASAMEGLGCPRILPTEYLLVLLDEDQDEDAMLLGAQFCSDSFSSISLDAVKNESSSYSFYARIESIGPLEIQGKSKRLQRKQIVLVDNDDVKMKFSLWGKQVLLANLLCVGSMLAMDRPYIENASCSDNQTDNEICLECGSSTQLYLVPFNHHEEQVLVTSTQNCYEGSRLSAVGQTQGAKVSQVSLPCDSQGSINFSNYPFRSLIVDLRDKMTGISLYGTVKSINRLCNTEEVTFSIMIEDGSGSVDAKLHFLRSWSLGRLIIGHSIFIAGLTCNIAKRQMLEVSWFERDAGAVFFNLSSLPALLNSSCLYKLSHLSHLAAHCNMTHVCRVRLDQIEYQNLKSIFLHTLCGQYVNEKSDRFLTCNFCCCTCDGEIIRAFYLEATLVDETTKVQGWCTGQTAAELLQISPEEFFVLPQDEQAMYLYTLQNECFMVALVNCEVGGKASIKNQWNAIHKCEIVRALKCE